MYLRFKKYLQSDRNYSLKVEIIESYRDEVTGEPRNRFVAYFGTIKEQDCSNKVLQEKFWRGADKKLSDLHLSASDEQLIREKLLARIPRPRSWEEILSSYTKFAHKRTIVC
ncbi:MAG TPA: hypothetical protein VEX70_16475 [Pyrinomonadaceae bacterium]|nr:hypothetical protein [Pyrinomonadaceae bacterium]